MNKTVIPLPKRFLVLGEGAGVRGESINLLGRFFICKTLIPDPSPLVKSTQGEGSRVLLM